MKDRDIITDEQTKAICELIKNEAQSEAATRREERLPLPLYEEMVF